MDLRGPIGRRSADLSRPTDVALAARELAAGAVLAHPFASIYALTSRPDRETVRAVNLLKGRPPDQPGSLTTTRTHLPAIWDWDRLPAGLSRFGVLHVVDALLELGPFGFRGPAAPHVPDHLSAVAGGVRTAQAILPGYRCPSTDLIARSLTLAQTRLLAITSANRSRHASGAAEEPPHRRAEGILADFGHEPLVQLVRHPDELAMAASYPWHAPTSTSILAFHRALAPEAGGRVRLVLERHGSLHVDDVRRVVAPFGVEVELGPDAGQRLAVRPAGAPGTSLSLSLVA